jgi:hypothetical protein
MAEWSVKPIWKKSIIERNYYHKDGATITAETGWRWGEFIVYTDDDNPPDIEAGVDMYNCEYETEMVETSDGCWEEVTVDDEDLEEWLEEFLEENSYLDLEEEGWMMGDSEMIFDSDLEITRVDGDEEQIIRTGDTKEIVSETKAISEEPAQWPFTRPEEGKKDVN